jgi:hypothetical protein
LAYVLQLKKLVAILGGAIGSNTLPAASQIAAIGDPDD